ncbi:GNAT family N-acetyltransferase [Pseudonocardiaceae bacterium YIM PH 21723]|nr:GNAT family N-acetyltransferase [Pseudonocardiaceae bacterium YIM PH 21723]
MDVVDAVESVEQLAVGWKAVALDRDPAADVRDLPGIAVRWVDGRFAFWNAITLTETGIGPETLDLRLAQIVQIMRTKHRPGFLWLFEDLLTAEARAELPGLIDRTGLSWAMDCTAMAGDVLPIPEPTHPDLTFVRVTTDEQLTAYADLNSRAYGFDLADGRDGLEGSGLWRSGIHAYLALRDGIPVACAGTVDTAGRLFVVLVATDPEHQGKGYGEAVTRKALHEGHLATGLSRATLHATEAGRPVYARIGLRPGTRIPLYSLKD